MIYCERLRINGVLTHEIGCSSAWRDYPRACFECGCDFLPASRFDRVCADCHSADSYDAEQDGGAS